MAWQRWVWVRCGAAAVARAGPVVYRRSPMRPVVFGTGATPNGWKAGWPRQLGNTHPGATPPRKGDGGAGHQPRLDTSRSVRGRAGGVPRWRFSPGRTGHAPGRGISAVGCAGQCGITQDSAYLPQRAVSEETPSQLSSVRIAQLSTDPPLNEVNTTGVQPELTMNRNGRRL